MYDFGKSVTPARWRINPGTSQVEIFDADGKQLRPVAAYTERSYERPNKAKTIARLHLDPTGPLSASFEANLVGFNRLYVADTTPLSTSEGVVAFTAVGVLRTMPVSDGITAVEFEAAALLEFHGLGDINPELAGWATVIDLVRRAPDYDPSWLVGLIGDSELNQLPDFNERRFPIAGSGLLPHNFRMHYAGDASADGMLNMSIRRCDNVSRHAVERLIRESPPQTDQRLPPLDVPCDWWRLWVRVPNQNRALFEVAEASARVNSYFQAVESPLLIKPRVQHVVR